MAMETILYQSLILAHDRKFTNNGVAGKLPEDLAVKP
jgi:hypothetical protein